MVEMKAKSEDYSQFTRSRSDRVLTAKQTIDRNSLHCAPCEYVRHSTHLPPPELDQQRLKTCQLIPPLPMQNHWTREGICRPAATAISKK